MKSPPTLLLVLVSTLCTIGAQLLLKSAIKGGALSSLTSTPVKFILAVGLTPATWLALSLQVFGYIVWFFVLARGDVAVVFALSGSFFYLLMGLGAWIVLGEALTPYQWAGIILISVGVALMVNRQTNL